MGLPGSGSAGPCPAAPALVGADRWSARCPHTRKTIHARRGSTTPGSAGPCPAAPALVGADRWSARCRRTRKTIYPRRGSTTLGSAGPCPAAPALVGADRWSARCRRTRKTIHAWRGSTNTRHRTPVAPGHARRLLPLRACAKTIHAWRGSTDVFSGPCPAAPAFARPRKTIHAWRGSTDVLINARVASINPRQDRVIYRSHQLHKRSRSLVMASCSRSTATEPSFHEYPIRPTRARPARP